MGKAMLKITTATNDSAENSWQCYDERPSVLPSERHACRTGEVNRMAGKNHRADTLCLKCIRSAALPQSLMPLCW